MSGRGSGNRGGRGGGRGGGDGSFPFRPRGGGQGQGQGGGGDRGGGRGGFRGGFHGGGDRGGGGRGDFRGGGRGGGGGGGRGGGGAVSVVTGAPPPDAAVANLENAILKAKPAGKLDASRPFPMRPGYGTKGTAVTLWANYVVLTAVAKPQLVLHRYDVSVTPAVTGKKRTQVLRIFLEDTAALAGHRADIVTDYKSTLIARTRLPVDDSFTGTVVYRLEGEDAIEDDGGSGLPATRREFTVQLLYTNTLPVADLLAHLSSTSSSAAASAEPSAHYTDALPTIQALNIFFNHHAKTSPDLVAVGAAKTFSLKPGSEWDLGSGLTALRGVFASVRMATARLLVNVNVSNGAFYQTGPLDQLMQARTGGYVTAGNVRRLEAFLKRVRVRTTHLKDKTNRKGEVIPRLKTIFGLATTNDGHGQEHPPRVARFGAGPKDVQFWLDGPAGQGSGSKQAADTPKGGKKGKGGKGGKTAGPQPRSAAGGRYISVYDFFLQSESSSEYHILLNIH